MKLDGNDFWTNDLDQLQTKLDRWREKQRGRTRLPQEVWQSATRLARQLGVNPVSRQLRLSYTDLRRRVEETGGNPAADRAAFVELAWQPPAQPVRLGDFRAELEKERLTLHLGDNVEAVVAVAEAFWRGEP